MVLLISCDNSSLVIDKLCDEAGEEDSAIMYFYFDFAARKSPVNMLGILLRQLVSGPEEILEVEGFRKKRGHIGGNELRVLEI